MEGFVESGACPVKCTPVPSKTISPGPRFVKGSSLRPLRLERLVGSELVERSLKRAVRKKKQKTNHQDSKDTKDVIFYLIGDTDQVNHHALWAIFTISESTQAARTILMLESISYEC